MTEHEQVVAENGADDEAATDLTESYAAAPASEGFEEDSAAPSSGVAALPLRPSLEAILLVVDEPIDVPTLASAVDRPSGEVAEAVRLLAEEYAEQDRGFELREIGGGWRLYTREQYAEVVERFVLDGQQAKLTQAALETLAVVAYRQPVSRARVSAIRGVNCDGVMKTLVNRSLVEEAGSDDESNAVLYRTTSYFLERLGLTSLEQLPDLAPYLPEVEQLEPDESSAPAAGDTESAERGTPVDRAAQALTEDDSTVAEPDPDETLDHIDGPDGTDGASADTDDTDPSLSHDGDDAHDGNSAAAVDDKPFGPALAADRFAHGAASESS